MPGCNYSRFPIPRDWMRSCCSPGQCSKPAPGCTPGPDKTVTADQQQQFEQFLQRRLQGEPIAHILGEQEFWSLRLQVTADTLIPRADTERLVELALERVPDDADWSIVDLGTGSGAIALALAKERPGCRILAVDQSSAALNVARGNAQRLGLFNLAFIQANWLESIQPVPCFQMIVANPPYIRADDPHLVRGDVRFEPRQALAAGADGLAAIRRIVQQARDALCPGGWLLLEHGYDQGEAVQALLADAEFEEVTDFIDYGDNPRVAVGRRAMQ